MRRRKRSRKPIEKSVGMSDKERRMRRERERLDKPFRGHRVSTAKKAAWGIVNGLSYTILILGIFVLILIVIFRLF